MKIGIFGGTFNPVHNGHLRIAREALERFSLERVLFIPAASPPHKTDLDIADSKHRAEMVALAVEGEPNFELSRLEIQRGKISYSVDTAESLAALYKGCSLFFLIGMDTLAELPTWKEIHRLMSLVSFIIVTRPGQSAEESLAYLRGFFSFAELEKIKKGILSGPAVDISSTMVRKRIKKGQSITSLVPAQVADYIARTKLYSQRKD